MTLEEYRAEVKRTKKIKALKREIENRKAEIEALKEELAEREAYLKKLEG